MINIAVCDDDIIFLKNIISSSLLIAAKKAGEQISVTQFANGLKLLNQFQSNMMYDIVILDIDMPAINGKELAKELRQINKSFSLVFISSFPCEVFDTIKYGIDAFIPKGTDYLDYVPELSRVIKDYSLRRASFECLKIYRNGEPVSIRVSIDNIIGFYIKDHLIYLKTLSEELLLQEEIFRNIRNHFINYDFFECSRNTLINLANISEIRPSSVLFKNKDTMPVSRRRIKSLIEAFNNHIAEDIIN